MSSANRSNVTSIIGMGFRPRVSGSALAFRAHLTVLNDVSLHPRPIKTVQNPVPGFINAWMSP
jgi:hypothetical protein